MSWTMESSWDVIAKADIRMTAQEGDITYLAEKGKYSAESKQDMSLKTGANLNMEAAGTSKLKSSAHTIEAGTIKLGSGGAAEPGVLGNQLVGVLSAISGGIKMLQDSLEVPLPNASAAMAPVDGMISTILAKKVFLE